MGTFWARSLERSLTSVVNLVPPLRRVPADHMRLCVCVCGLSEWTPDPGDHSVVAGLDQLRTRPASPDSLDSRHEHTDVIQRLEPLVYTALLYCRTDGARPGPRAGTPCRAGPVPVISSVLD